MIKQSRHTSQDKLHQNGAIPGVINKKVNLADAKHDRDIAAAAVLEAFLEAYPPDAQMPDEFDFSAHGQIRNRHQRPGAHVVLRADKIDKRRVTVNVTTKNIE